MKGFFQEKKKGSFSEISRKIYIHSCHVMYFLWACSNLCEVCHQYCSWRDYIVLTMVSQ